MNRIPVLLIALLALSVCVSVPVSAQTPAPGAPGALSHFGLGRKECVGTARSADSKVWFTVAGGILSDVYAPTIDNTNLESLQFIVTDGRTFTDLQSRDMTYTVRTPDDNGMVCEVTSTARNGRYRLVTQYLTDPARNSLVIRTQLEPSARQGDDLHLYVRYDASINGNGGGGPSNGGADDALVDPNTSALVSTDKNTASSAPGRDYGTPLSGALRTNCPFVTASSGYAGTDSDGLVQLDRDRKLTNVHAEAPQGNVAQTARLLTVPGQPNVLALGFAPTPDEAVKVAGASLATPYEDIYKAYTSGWRKYTDGLATRPAGDPALFKRSLSVLKASEDKTFPGAVVSSLAGPWGQAVSAGNLTGGKPTYFGFYRDVGARDMYHAFTALLFSGDQDTARSMVRWLFERQQEPDGRMPRKSLLNGKRSTDLEGEQIDETAYPIVMAQQAGLDGDKPLYTDHIRRAADFIMARGPAFGRDRWQEQDGHAPSTIAAEIAGLVLAGSIADRQGDQARARLYRATADHYQRNVKNWTVTDTGPQGRHFIRLAKTGDPNAPIAYNLGRGSVDVDQRSVLDAGFLELTRFGVLPPADLDVARSLQVVDQSIKRDTPTGPGWYRYGTAIPGTEDGYGDCHEPDPTVCVTTGKPWPTGQQGSGHPWPLLAGERAEQALQTGDKKLATELLGVLARQASAGMLVPEQIWENGPVPPSPFGTDPAIASIGFVPGQPTGAPTPFTWAQAQYARLALSIKAGHPVEQPAEVRRRYVDTCQCPPLGVVPVTLDGAGGTGTITGKTLADAQVDVAMTALDSGTTTVTSAKAGTDGTFSVAAPAMAGSGVITVAATLGKSNGYVQRSL